MNTGDLRAALHAYKNAISFHSVAQALVEFNKDVGRDIADLTPIVNRAETAVAAKEIAILNLFKQVASK